MEKRMLMYTPMYDNMGSIAGLVNSPDALNKGFEQCLLEEGIINDCCTLNLFSNEI